MMHSQRSLATGLSVAILILVAATIVMIAVGPMLSERAAFLYFASAVCAIAAAAGGRVAAIGACPALLLGIYFSSRGGLDATDIAAGSMYAMISVGIILLTWDAQRSGAPHGRS